MSERLLFHDKVLARTLHRLVPASVTPNHLTLFRLFATPGVLWLIYVERYGAAIAAFLFLAFTDMLDGSLARVRGRVTEWGMAWDPVADKALVASAAALLILRQFPTALAWLIIGTEAVIVLAGFIRRLDGHSVSANRWGKAKMFLQVVAVTLFLFSLAAAAPVLATASYALFAAAIVLAMVSLAKSGL